MFGSIHRRGQPHSRLHTGRSGANDEYVTAGVFAGCLEVRRHSRTVNRSRVKAEGLGQRRCTEGKHDGVGAVLELKHLALLAPMVGVH